MIENFNDYSKNLSEAKNLKLLFENILEQFFCPIVCDVFRFHFLPSVSIIFSYFNAT